MEASGGNASFDFRTSVRLEVFWKMQPFMQPSQIRLPTMQMHSLRDYYPPCRWMARSISQSQTLLPTMRDRRFIRLRQRRTRTRSISRQMPRFSHTFWYFWLSYSQALKLHYTVAAPMEMYSLKSSLSAVLMGLNSLPSNILQGMRYLSTNFFCDLVLRAIFERHSSAYLRFSLISAYLPRWKRQLSTYLGPKSPQILGAQTILCICSQLWKESRMDTCMMSISGRNSFFMSYPIARADLKRCRVLRRVFLSLAAAELWLTFRQADKKMRFVARRTVRKGFDSHSRYSFISSSTFTMAIRHCMCLSKASDHLPPARSKAKSLTNSTTLAKLVPVMPQQSPKICELTATFQLRSGTASQWLVQYNSFNSRLIFSPSFLWNAP